MSSETERHDGDEELVERARSAPEGDLRAFELLVLRHQGRILANCRYLSRSPDDAEDLAQEVFVKAFFGLARFEGRSSFGTWLQRIKVNHCLNFLKKGEGRSFVDVESPEMQANPELSVAPAAEKSVRSRNQRERIAEVLDRMSSTLRVPLILRDLDGLSYARIADDLGIGLSAVKMRIKRAREEFRRLYQGEDPESSPDSVLASAEREP